MKINEVTLLSSNNNQFLVNDFEEAFLNSLRRYSMKHLPYTEEVSQENIMEALQKSLQLCHLAGINGSQHFKKIFIYDADVHAIQVDWRMSKKGLNLMVMQSSQLNERLARWLCELAD